MDHVNVIEWLKNFVLKRPVETDNPEVQRKYWFRAWVATIIYSVAYGQYEYWVVYNGPRFIDALHETANWSIMYILTCVIAAIASRGRIQEVFFAVIFMAMLEDVSFWIGLWIDTEEYPVK
mmetsp:Transcript_20216/g.24507  ORF Transcript_20216/g.24507 Transcript_20216/m.24507 type:complete len:121 (+) Transcript_20216:50-412(+)